MAFAKLCANFDLLGLDRKVIGFDTFEGFPSISHEDSISQNNDELKKGGFKSFSSIQEELNDCIHDFDANRFIAEHKKIELIKGDATLTIPNYISQNPQTMISLLYLDFDLYEPTKIALEYFAPRVVKGGIIAFDELNQVEWKGESIAMIEYFGNLNSCRFQKFDFNPGMSFLVVE